MLWPVCLLVLTYFPYHVHQHLVSSFHLSIGLSMVRWNPNLPDGHRLGKLSDDVSFKVGSSVTQKLGRCSEDGDKSLPQKLSNSLHSLIRGHICHDMFHKVVTKDQNVNHVWGLIKLDSCLNTGIVKMWQPQRCSNNDGLYWGFGMSVFMLDALLTAASVWPFQTTRTGHVTIRAFAADSGVQPLSDIHSWWLLDEPWGLWTT